MKFLLWLLCICVACSAVAAEKPRVVVLTDIGNEPDDSESMVRFLLYSNEFDVEGLLAVTSTWLRSAVHPEMIEERVRAYGQVLPNLEAHAPGYPEMQTLLRLIRAGRPEYGMAGVGKGKDTEASKLIREFHWAPGRVLYDDPASINDSDLRTLRKSIFEQLDRVERELLIESAYFIPLSRGVDKIRELRAKGIRIRVLTNSLASNDVLAAFAGYSAQRVALLNAGVDLYELRPEPGPVRKRLFGLGGRSGLHTKAIVFDRKAVFVGSFNLDARSASINTEAGLYIESVELAREVAAVMDEGVDPDNAFRVQLDADGRLFWTNQDDGVPMRYDTEPLSTLMQRMQAAIVRMLPIADQL